MENKTYTIRIEDREITVTTDETVAIRYKYASIEHYLTSNR